MPGILAGRIAFVTGTARGIGRSTVQALAAAGADVYAHARVVDEAFRADMARIAADHGVRIQPLEFDLRDSAHMKQVVTTQVDRHPGIDILINNAGVAHGGMVQMTPMQDIRAVFDVNFFAQIELTQLLLRRMNRHRPRSVVNVASISGLDSKAGNIAYGTSKAALIAATRTMASELAASGVRVNAVAPGLIDTDMAGQMDPKAGKAMIEASAMRRLGRPDEIAAVILFLVSDQASFVNGQVIRLDGGSQ